jgi:hypothetical protein
VKSHASICGLSFAFCFHNLLERVYKVRALCSQASAFGHESTELCQHNKMCVLLNSLSVSYLSLRFLQHLDMMSIHISCPFLKLDCLVSYWVKILCIVWIKVLYYMCCLNVFFLSLWLVFQFTSGLNRVDTFVYSKVQLHFFFSWIVLLLWHLKLITKLMVTSNFSCASY